MVNGVTQWNLKGIWDGGVDVAMGELDSPDIPRNQMVNVPCINCLFKSSCRSSGKRDKPVLREKIINKTTHCKVP